MVLKLESEFAVNWKIDYGDTNHYRYLVILKKKRCATLAIFIDSYLGVYSQPVGNRRS